MAVDQEDVKAQVNLARGELRRVFVAADAGLIGANALIADSGSVMLVTNEGNGDLVSTLPNVLIVIAGWEKLVPTLADAGAHLRLLARSGTGQEITTYTSFITGAEPGREVHIVLVDNGRTAMWRDPEFRDALRCIRCAACADVCPPYQVVGGHVFGHVYSGAIGLVNTPFHHGLDAAAGPQSLCVSCNACATVCPVDIPLPRLILDVRSRVAAARGIPLLKRLAFAIWTRPRLFNFAARSAAVLTRPLVRRTPRGARFLRLPLPPAHRWRSIPALAARPARNDLFGRVFEPDPSGPWSQSKARDKTAAYFVQCITDRAAPEQALATVRVLQACGARVVVPRDQHCCGLPQLDAGDTRGAKRLAKQTIASLEAVAADYVVTAAASCAVAILHDYAHLLRDEPEWAARAQRQADRTLDLLSFLDRVAAPPPLPRVDNAPLLTVHSFCQSTNVLGLGQLGAQLLRHAGWTVAELAEADVCCGFGGGASIDHPLVARGIADRKLANVAETNAAVLCTDNPGCILHLRGAADAARLPIDLRHVAELLAQRLDNS
jgi:Fe-S oxidoreductase